VSLKVRRLGMSKFTLVLDSSQISMYLECPQLWYNKYVLKLEPNQTQPADAMNAGTYGHKLLDIYYRLRRRGGLSLNSIVEVCFAYDPDNDTCECGCAKDLHKVIPSINITECQRCKKCLKFRPHPFPLNQENRYTVRNRFRDYVFKYQDNDFMAHSEDSVEVGFSEPIYEDSENLFVLEGRIDLMGTIQGLSTIVDHKFQLRSHKLYKKSVQFRNYALISKTLMMFINYIRLSKKIDDTTLVRDPVVFTIPELLEWKKKLIGIYMRIKKDLLEVGPSGGLWHNWSACPGKYNYECQFTTLCEENDPTMLEIKKNQLYTIKEETWRPW
jgi:hypothetical protein